MTNIEDDDVNLGLGMSFTKFGIRARVLSASGAGVNADSRLDLAFPASDPLSELVWSPNDGLSLKRGDPRAADNKPLLVWNVGPSSAEDLSPLQSIILKESGDDAVVDRAVLRADDMIIEEEADKKLDAVHEENCTVDQEAKLESFAENHDLCHLTEEEDCRNRVHRERGKEKALSDGDIYGGSLDDEDGSGESSNSDALSSKGIKGKKRQINDEGVMLGSKRVKKQIHGSSHGSPSATRHGSSFLNWITNMTKVSPLTLAESESLACFKRQGKSASISMGFQTIFQSVSCRETDVGGNKIALSVEESRECAVDDLVSPATSDEVEERDPLTSFWITRLSTKTHKPERGKEIAEETNRWSTSCTKAELDCRTNVVSPMPMEGKRYESADSKFSTPNSETSLLVKSMSKLCPVLPWKRFSSEAMASVFARRITSSKLGNSTTHSHVCFFCGDVHECPNVTKPELEDLLLKLNTLDRVEESSCLCIRCSQSDHWAISCPLAPSDAEHKDSLVDPLQLYDGDGDGDGEDQDHKLLIAGADHIRTDCSSRKPLIGLIPTEISSSTRVRASSDMQRSPALKMTKYVDEGRSSLQYTATQTEILHAIRSLRLTRADILRWMNSKLSLSHLNGFFVRVRLGKPQVGLGGSSYHVACVTGDAPDNGGYMSMKSIFVDVGGIKSAVSSQYVSNHDFLEDEIKAWWWRTLDSGCRIPSLVELNSKLNDRKLLGFS